MIDKKKERTTEFNRQNILEAAKKLFSERGMSQTTMDDVAKESQYSKSTIYVYFKSKDEIYNHIVFENMMLLRQGLGKAIDGSETFEAAYYAICNTLVSFHETVPLYFDSILGKISVEQEEFDKQTILRKIYEAGEEINGIMENFLEDGISKKQVFEHIKPLQTAFTLWASICGLISFADKKESYIRLGMQMNKQEFLQYGFETLSRTILNNRRNEQ